MASAPPKVPTSRQPTRVFFGPKDPQTGEQMEEVPYVHQDYPKTIYHKEFGELVVNDAEEHEAAGSGWQEVPFGPPHAPSQEEIAAMRKAEITAKINGKEITPEEKAEAAKAAIKGKAAKHKAKA